jgi:hypothetical protein
MPSAGERVYPPKLRFESDRRFHIENAGVPAGETNKNAGKVDGEYSTYLTSYDRVRETPAPAKLSASLVYKSHSRQVPL